MGIVPYICRLFAREEGRRDLRSGTTAGHGLILHKPRIFTFGDSAQEAYERMIEW